MSFVEFHDVKKIYRMGEIEIHALRDVNFRVEKGEFCVVVGASGAGKTTILNILGGMDTLSEGSVWLDGKEISAYNKRQLTEYRRYDIGFPCPGRFPGFPVYKNSGPVKTSQKSGPYIPGSCPRRYR